MLIDAEWCALFRDWKVGVGVSLDGPRELHDANRKTRSGRRHLRPDDRRHPLPAGGEAAVPRHLGAVGREPRRSRRAARLLSSPRASTTSASMSRNPKAATSRSSSRGERAALTRYAGFLRRFWHAARESGRVKFLREIDLAIPRVFRPSEAHLAQHPDRAARPCSMSTATATSRASRPSCSASRMRPMATSCWATSTPIRWPASTRPACDRRCSATSRRASRPAAPSCEYFSVCGGGAPVNKLFENGSLRQHQNLLLHAHPDRADRSHPRGLRPPRAELDRRRCSFNRRAQIPRRPQRPSLHHRGCHDQIDAVRHRFTRRRLVALGAAYAQAPPAAGQQPAPGPAAGAPAPGGAGYGSLAAGAAPGVAEGVPWPIIFVASVELLRSQGRPRPRRWRAGW